MQAYIFGDMLYHSIKAQKGEKGKTLIERAVNDFTYFIAMSLGIMGMHKIPAVSNTQSLDVKRPQKHTVKH